MAIEYNQKGIASKKQNNRDFTLSQQNDPRKRSGGLRKRKTEAEKYLSPFFVRMIGLEPTCREALAPETSVSTISPHPLAKSGTKIQNVFEIERKL